MASVCLDRTAIRRHTVLRMFSAAAGLMDEHLADEIIASTASVKQRHPGTAAMLANLSKPRPAKAARQRAEHDNAHEQSFAPSASTLASAAPPTKVANPEHSSQHPHPDDDDSRFADTNVLEEPDEQPSTSYAPLNRARRGRSPPNDGLLQRRAASLGAAPPSLWLLRQVRAARSWVALRRALLHSRGQMSPTACALMWEKLAALHPDPRRLSPQERSSLLSLKGLLAEVAQHFLPDMQMHEVVSVLHSFATLQLPDPELQQATFCQLRRHARRLSPAQATATLTAVAAWQQQAIVEPEWLEELLLDIQPALAGFTAADMGSLFAALAALSYLPASQQFLDACHQQVLAVLPDCQASALLHVLQLYAAVQYIPDQDVLQPVLERLQACLPSAAGPVLADLLAALAEIQVVPWTEWMTEYYATTQAKLCELGSSHLARLALGLAGVQQLPPEAFLAQLARLTSVYLPQCSCQDLADIAQGLAGIRYPVLRPWTEGFMAAVEARWGRLSAGQLSTILWSLVVLDPPLITSQWLQQCEQYMVRQGQYALQQDIHKAMAAFMHLQHSPSKQWIETFLLDLRHQSMEDLSTSLWALSTYGYAPVASWWQGFEEVSSPELSHLESHTLLKMLAALSKLGYQPSRGWLALYLAAVEPRAFSPRELFFLLDALAAIQCKCEPRWCCSVLRVSSASNQAAWDDAALASVQQAFGRVGYDATREQLTQLITNSRRASKTSTASIH